MRNLLIALTLLTLLALVLGALPVVVGAAPAAAQPVFGRLDHWLGGGGSASTLQASPSDESGGTSFQAEDVLGSGPAARMNPSAVPLFRRVREEVVLALGAPISLKPALDGLRSWPGAAWVSRDYGQHPLLWLEAIVGPAQGPDIRVDPTELSEILWPDEQRTVPLDICNDGTTALEWSLEEMPGAYVQETLWDNGPLVTHPGGGYGGADASALQTSLGMSNYGFGHQAFYGHRVADDFMVDEWWTIDHITFFAYQTNAPTDPSTFTGYNLAVWDGPPGGGGSVIWGDYQVNCLIDTSWMGAFRVRDTIMMGATRPIMSNVCETPGLVLPPGQYWLDWQADASLPSGPWAPPISILGETTTGDGLQSLNNGVTFSPAVDDGTNTPQGFPFIIEGTRGVPDIPWLSEDPTSGTVPSGDCQVVDVTFDATGLGLDVYTCVLLITSNDPDQPEVWVPVTLSVSGGSWVYLPLTMR